MSEEPTRADAAVDVSVVLLTYNHERFLAQAIESVLAQQGVSLELLIVEDCSTDRTREIAHAYRDRLPGQVRLFLSPENRNSNAILAAPFAETRGRYVATLDGDDYWTAPDKLRRQTAYLDATPSCALCFHDVQVVDEDGRPPSGADAPRGGAAASAAEVRTYTLGDMLDHNLVPGCSPLMRREALTPLPAWFYDAEYGDWPMYLHVMHRGTADRLPSVLGAYRVHGGGYWSRQRRRHQIEGRRRFAALLRRHLAPEHQPRLREIETRLDARLVRLCAAEGDVPGALRRVAAVARAVASAPRRQLGRGAWRTLAHALRSSPPADAAT